MDKIYYCGPKAVSEITQADCDVIEDDINDYRGKPRGSRIVETYTGEIAHLIEKYTGRKVIIHSYLFGHRMPTLTQFDKYITKASPVVVLVTGHFIVYHDGMVKDYKHDYEPVRQTKYKRRRVRAVIEMMGCRA
jgi:hypothetical protein